MAMELADPQGGGRRRRETALSDTKPMRHRMFHRPVTIERRRIDRDRVVTNTKTALESLLREWPLPECPNRQLAISACLEVMRGEKPPAVARRAFVTAARSAGILLED